MFTTPLEFSFRSEPRSPVVLPLRDIFGNPINSNLASHPNTYPNPFITYWHDQPISTNFSSTMISGTGMRFAIGHFGAATRIKCRGKRLPVKNSSMLNAGRLRTWLIDAGTLFRMQKAVLYDARIRRGEGGWQTVENRWTRSGM
jgi:hypothetical protein